MSIHRNVITLNGWAGRAAACLHRKTNRRYRGVAGAARRCVRNEDESNVRVRVGIGTEERSRRVDRGRKGEEPAAVAQEEEEEG